MLKWLVYVQVSDLISRMERDWPSLACPSSDGVRFWSHEWEKHGTCSGLNQHDYFQKALQFKTKANLLQNLKNAGIYYAIFLYTHQYHLNNPISNTTKPKAITHNEGSTLFHHYIFERQGVDLTLYWLLPNNFPAIRFWTLPFTGLHPKLPILDLFTKNNKHIYPISNPTY